MAQKTLAQLEAEMTPEAVAALSPLRQYGQLRADLPALAYAAAQAGVPRTTIAQAIGVTREGLAHILRRGTADPC